MGTLVDGMRLVNPTPKGQQRPYYALEAILLAVLVQASQGKGAERHARTSLWEKQRWRRITEGVGPGFLLGQAIKKLEEAQDFEDAQRIERELLGAMHYIAMAIYHYKHRGSDEGC